MVIFYIVSIVRNNISLDLGTGGGIWRVAHVYILISLRLYVQLPSAVMQFRAQSVFVSLLHQWVYTYTYIKKLMSPSP